MENSFKEVSKPVLQSLLGYLFISIVDNCSFIVSIFSNI